MRAAWLALLLMGCGDPSAQLDEGVGYRAGTDDTTSGERGTVKISEIFWSGSVTNDGVWDQKDAFVELRNEGNFNVNVGKWRIDLTGTIMKTFIIPEGVVIPVGGHVFFAAKDTGCFPNPDALIPDLVLPDGDNFELTLRDRDERLIEPAGDENMAPFAGGYDFKNSRSMEKIELMFGGRGDQQMSWHFYNFGVVDVPNNDRVAESCRQHTLASPGRPNSPDYSGAYASGSLD